MGCGGSGGDPSGNESKPEDDPQPAAIYEWDPADFDHVYDVGPDQDYADPNEIPWENLESSTLVRIYYRDTPYACKWVINVTATEDAPVVIQGIADQNRRPVITGENAVTRQALDYWNEPRSVIKVGGSSIPDNPDRPAWIYIQGLDIQRARPGYSFSDDSGLSGTYNNNAAVVHIEEGDFITLYDCALHDASNGLFSSSSTSDITISSCFIYDNGIEGSIYQHNSYTESRGIVFEFNHYGPLRTGCLGNNLKDRSSGTVIRYNWIEAGNRQLDLVETDYDHIADDPGYDRTFVYGNVLIEPDGAGNSQILHYGGDGGDTSMYRNGTLYFYHNTVVSTRSGNATLMRLSTNTVHAEVFNNILFASAGGSYLAITSGYGQTVLRDNWLPTGWRLTHESGLDPGATVTDSGNVEGDIPGFVDLNSQDFNLSEDGEALDGAGEWPSEVSGYPPEYQYICHQNREVKPSDATPDMGAFERAQ